MIDSALSDGKKSVTIRDVARVANVSVAAVSQALNNVGNLKSETRQRIRQVASELGYVANRYAAGLRKSRAMVVGYVSNTDPDAETEKRWAHYYGKQLNALVRAAGSRGYTVTVIPDNRPDLLALAQVDVLYLADVLAASQTVVEATRRGIPMVTYEFEVPGVECVVVEAGYERATLAALEFLSNKGCTRVGLLTEEDGYVSDEVGRKIYESWCTSQGVTPVVVMANSSRSNLDEKLTELLGFSIDGFFSFYEEGPAIQRFMVTRQQAHASPVPFVALCLEDCVENSRLGVSHVCVRPEQAPSSALDRMFDVFAKKNDVSTVVDLPIFANF